MFLVSVLGCVHAFDRFSIPFEAASTFVCYRLNLDELLSFSAKYLGKHNAKIVSPLLQTTVAHF